jgi:hypothetical protein
MQVKGKPQQRGIATRKLILDQCLDEPKSLQQLSDATNISIETLRYNIAKLMPRYMKRYEATTESGNEAHFYEATKHDYMADIEKEEETQLSQFTKDGETPEWLTVVKCRHNPSVAVRRSAWTGTTLGSMTF